MVVNCASFWADSCPFCDIGRKFRGIGRGEGGGKPDALETRADAGASALEFSKCGRISGIICYLNYYFLLLQRL